MSKATKMRGPLAALSPLMGHWRLSLQSIPSGMPTDCSRSFTRFGDRYVVLSADWVLGQGKTYQELCLFGVDEMNRPAFWSFTSDGKRSVGVHVSAADIHDEAIAFEADMPGGRARMIYWPGADGGLNFAVERHTRKGWNRFLEHHYLTTNGSKK